MFRPPIKRTVHVVAIRTTESIAATVLWVSFMAFALERKVSAWWSLIVRVVTDYRIEAHSAATHVSEKPCGTTVPRKSAQMQKGAHPGALGETRRKRMRRSSGSPTILHSIDLDLD